MIETATHITGIGCDARGCDASVPGRGPDGIPWMIPIDARRRCIGAALERGWSAWWGRRGQRHYCPAHGPRQGHLLTQITLDDLGPAPAGGWSWW